MQIKNPILPGFNPDPSICQAGDDFYIATSTFEWFPGVQIHHSKDLVNWHLLTRPLSRKSQLDMAGDPCSSGIWAPCLTYADGLFWLIYTDNKCLEGEYNESNNYLVTAPDIMGPWSDPVYLNSSGFDPSLFHDDDGHKWLINMIWDFRPGKYIFGGILLQEYSVKEQKLIGPIKNIFDGTELKCTEGPHLYKRNCYYYLLTAEGGTGYDHAVTMARSKNIDGPYEVDPHNPMLTSRGKDVVLKKAGHASFIDLPNGSVYMVHLCGRPLPNTDKCILGRETSIQKCEWTAEGWLKLTSGDNAPLESVEAPDLKPAPFEKEPARRGFDSGEIPLEFQSLRIPMDSSWVSLTERPGWLRLYGRDLSRSRFHQSLLGRRVESFKCEASCALQFKPDSFQQLAGLMAWYNTSNHYYLHITWHEEHGRCLRLYKVIKRKMEILGGEGIPLGDTQTIYLKASIDNQALRFYYSLDNVEWQQVSQDLDAAVLSDEFAEGFTGAFFAMAATDQTGKGLHADFDWFEYRDIE